MRPGFISRRLHGARHPPPRSCSQLGYGTRDGEHRSSDGSSHLARAQHTIPHGEVTQSSRFSPVPRRGCSGHPAPCQAPSRAALPTGIPPQHAVGRSPASARLRYAQPACMTRSRAAQRRRKAPGDTRTQPPQTSPPPPVPAPGWGCHPDPPPVGRPQAGTRGGGRIWQAKALLPPVLGYFWRRISGEARGFAA